MHCREFEIISGALLEGEAHPEAYAHLASCRRCRLLVDELGAVERAARSLPVHEPGVGLWARIEAAAAAEGLLPPSVGWGWFGVGVSWLPARPAFAGALALMLLVAAGLVSYPTMELPVAAMVPADPIDVAQSELVQEASYESRYRIHLDRVERRLLAESSPQEAELRELVARPMAVVDRAIQQTALQLNEHPEDTLAREELHRLYQQKATVLQAMAESSWYRDGR
jgi:hypothetical protein